MHELDHNLAAELKLKLAVGLVLVGADLAVSCGLGGGRRTFASMRFGAIPAEMVSPVLSKTSARSFVTTSVAVMLYSDIYGVMLQSALEQNKVPTSGILRRGQP